MDEIAALAEPLKGQRVLHLSATAFGGGVAEILYTLVPLMQDAGLDTEWRDHPRRGRVLRRHEGDPQRRSRATRPALTEEQKEIFRRYTKLNADALEGDFDVVIVHDAQPVGMIEEARDHGKHWIFRCHIDLSEPNPDVLDFLTPWIARYDASVYHRRDYVPDELTKPPAYIWPPAIDPLAPKNMALSPEDASYIVDQFGIDVNRRLITQVSRFDPWKDPLGVIDAWRIVREKHPDVQLALVGSMAHDDPEGWDYYNRTVAAADGDPDVFILSNLNNVGSVEVNAFQVHSDALMQKSTREGFGLTVTEALWKSRPIVAGPRGRDRRPDPGRRDRLPRRVDRGVRRRGHAASSTTPRRARVMARKGKEYVRQHFLTPRLLRDWLALFNLLDGRETDQGRELEETAAV